MNKRVLLVTWPGADWRILGPLLDEGALPNLEKLVNRGVVGNLASQPPLFGPMVSGSLCTGCRPTKHGALGFFAADAEQGTVRPISGLDRRRPALWDLQGQAGHRSLVVGWPYTHPAEVINGVFVSDQFCAATRPGDDYWPVLTDAVYPENRADELAELRLHPTELDGEQLRFFVPRMEDVEQTADKRLHILAQAVAEVVSVQAIATRLLETETWDFAAVCYRGISRVSHVFGHLAPPRMQFVPVREFELYSGVVSAMYRFHDMLLAPLVHLIGEETLLILASEHGFRAGHLRPRRSTAGASGAVKWHRELGVVCLVGEGVKRDERIYGASTLDVVPTILAHQGLPLPVDLDGMPLQQAFDAPLSVSYAETDTTEFRTADAEARAASLCLSEEELAEVMLQAGYIESDSATMPEMLEACQRETSYNLARAWIDVNRPQEAIPLLTKLLQRKMGADRYMLPLAQCYLSTGQLDECLDLLEWIIQQGTEEPKVYYLRGALAYAQGQYEVALAHLKKAEEGVATNALLPFQIGDVYLHMSRWQEAERAFRKAIGINPDHARAHAGLAAALLAVGRHDEAVEAALGSVGLLHFNLEGHYYLGAALAAKGDIPRSIQALEMAIKVRPNCAGPHRLLGKIHQQVTGKQEKAHYHQRMAMELSALDDHLVQHDTVRAT